MAFIVDRKFDRVIDLVNKIGRTSQEFEDRAQRLENSKISYDAGRDPEYIRGLRRRREEADLQEDVTRGNNTESTRGYDNSWNGTAVTKIYDDLDETNSQIRAQMRSEKLAAFGQDKQSRLLRLKNRFAAERYQELYDLNLAAEDYKFAFDKNFRREREREQRKKA